MNLQIAITSHTKETALPHLNKEFLFADLNFGVGLRHFIVIDPNTALFD